MRILTVRQPWASAIISGAKTVENRPTDVAGGYRGAVAIHAGVREDMVARSHPEVTRWAREYWGADATSLFVGDRTKFGHIIGVVDLVDVHWSGMECSRGPERCHEYGLCSPWAEAYTHHLVLANPRPLTEPIPYRGALGLRTLDDGTTARILAQIGEAA